MLLFFSNAPLPHPPGPKERNVLYYSVTENDLGIGETKKINEKMVNCLLYGVCVSHSFLLRSGSLVITVGPFLIFHRWEDRRRTEFEDEERTEIRAVLSVGEVIVNSKDKVIFNSTPGLLYPHPYFLNIFFVAHLMASENGFYI